MLNHGSHPPPLLGRAAGAAVRCLLSLFFLLALLGAPNPVHCLERDDACAGGRGAGPGTASCHDQSPASLPGCESCTDVAAPEESLARASRPGRNLEVPAAAFCSNCVASTLPVRETCSCSAPPTRLVRTPSFLRTTVLLI